MAMRSRNFRNEVHRSKLEENVTEIKFWFIKTSWSSVMNVWVSKKILYIVLSVISTLTCWWRHDLHVQSLFSAGKIKPSASKQLWLVYFENRIIIRPVAWWRSEASADFNYVFDFKLRSQYSWCNHDTLTLSISVYLNQTIKRVKQFTHIIVQTKKLTESFLLSCCF